MKIVVLGIFLTLLSSKLFAASDLIFVKQNSAPKYFQADKSQTGLCDAIYLSMQTLLERQGKKVSIDTTLYPIKRILAKLEQGNAHVFCGAGRNPERELKFHYSKLPVYAVSNVLLTHETNMYVTSSYQDLQDKKLIIGAFFGTSSARFLKKYEGIRVVDNFKTLDDAMNAVADKKIPYFYYHDLGLVYMVENSQLPIKVMPKKLRTVDQWMIYSRELPTELVETLDEALRIMTEKGTIADINARFF
jgi:ABC-type amino acid transport substrate-binding protein